MCTLSANSTVVRTVIIAMVSALNLGKFVLLLSFPNNLSIMKGVLFPLKLPTKKAKNG